MTIMWKLIQRIGGALIQFKANCNAELEIKAFVATSTVMSELKNMNTTLNARIDTIEKSYLDLLTEYKGMLEKYERRTTTRERREEEKEGGRIEDLLNNGPQGTNDPYEEIIRRGKRA